MDPILLHLCDRTRRTLGRTEFDGARCVRSASLLWTQRMIEQHRSCLTMPRMR